MSQTIDEITIRYEEDGVELVKEMGKHILTRGSWSTIMFLYQDWDRAKEEFGPLKVSIRRYQKRNDQYSQKSKFNISSAKQALTIAEILKQWFPET